MQRDQKLITGLNRCPMEVVVTRPARSALPVWIFYGWLSVDHCGER